MSRIDERLAALGIDASGLSDEEKFSEATGLTFYNDEVANNDWYVPSGAGNTLDEESSEQPAEPDQGQQGVQPAEPDQGQQGVQPATPDQGQQSTTDPVVEPDQGQQSTADPVVEPDQGQQSTTDPVVEPTDDPDQGQQGAPSELEIETEP